MIWSLSTFTWWNGFITTEYALEGLDRNVVVVVEDRVGSLVQCVVWYFVFDQLEEAVEEVEVEAVEAQEGGDGWAVHEGLHPYTLTIHHNPHGHLTLGVLCKNTTGNIQ